MPQPSFATERLIISPARESDVRDLHALWNDPDVARYLFDAEPVSIEVTESILRDCLGQSERGHGLWLLNDTASPRAVGCIGLVPTTVAADLVPSLSGLLEPIVALTPAYWKRGLASEALSELVSYAFKGLAQPEIAAVNDVPNTASERMLVRAGFTMEHEVQGPKYRIRTYRLEREGWERNHDA